MTSQGLLANRSSGNLIADRRFTYAEDLSAEGEHAAAVDLLEQTIDLVAGWAPGWLALGRAREKAGDPSGALAAFDRALALDPSDGLGVSLDRARLLGVAPETMPPAFVAALFDQYADRFDAHLTGSLGYRGPAVILHALGRADPPASGLAEVLDLGCGTGLMARALAGQAGAIDGVDLSVGMIEQARATGLYRRLAVGDIGSVMIDLPDGSYDGVMAADLLVYLGAHEFVCREVARLLRRGGVFAFTVQRTEGTRYELGADMRFSHSQSYIVGALAAAGLKPVLLEEVSTRRDREADVPGLVVVARHA